MSNFLRPHGLQHTRSPCPSPTLGVYANSCPLSWWGHPTISSSVIPRCLPLVFCRRPTWNHWINCQEVKLEITPASLLACASVPQAHTSAHPLRASNHAFYLQRSRSETFSIPGTVPGLSLEYFTSPSGRGRWKHANSPWVTFRTEDPKMSTCHPFLSKSPCLTEGSQQRDKRTRAVQVWFWRWPTAWNTLASCIYHISSLTSPSRTNCIKQHSPHPVNHSPLPYLIHLNSIWHVLTHFEVFICCWSATPECKLPEDRRFVLLPPEGSVFAETMAESRCSIGVC